MRQETADRGPREPQVIFRRSFDLTGGTSEQLFDQFIRQFRAFHGARPHEPVETDGGHAFLQCAPLVGPAVEVDADGGNIQPVRVDAGCLRAQISNGNEVEKPVDDGGMEHRRKQPCESETATKAGHLR